MSQSGCVGFKNATSYIRNMYFEKIDEKSLYYTASLWYQGLSYLKLKDKRNAKRVFQKLKAIEPYYQKQSAKLLKYL